MRLSATVIVCALAISAQANANSKPAKADKKICRREEVVGSIMLKSTCHTQEEWARIDTGNHDAGAASMRESKDNAPFGMSRSRG